MTLPDSDEDVVTALRYDEVAVASDLASWCGGELEKALDPDLPPTIWVPTSKGPRPAGLGDWIVRRMSGGGYYVSTPQEFAAMHEPLG